MSEYNNLIPVIKNGNLVKENIPQDGNFELVDEVNPRQANQKLIDAVKNGDLAAVTAALDAGGSPNYEAPKLVIDQHMSNVANDIVINQILMKGFNSDVIVGDIHGTAPLSESEMTMLVLHELGHNLRDGNTLSERKTFTKLEQQDSSTKMVKMLLDAGANPIGDIHGPGLSEEAKQLIHDAQTKDKSIVIGDPHDRATGLLVDPASLREKFTASDKKDKNTPK